jgi:[acyl-carrier-protein] S-malonyltransferase/trans-AT polyketide synthase/acyltransferase/oxidoreductase domain-containing protein
MARDFFTQYAVSREAFAEASDALGLDVAGLCFDEDARLDQTEYTQPAILTAEIAMMRALERELGLTAQYFGGHSLGEYTALCAAGVMSLGTAARLVRKRGALMQEAVPLGEGAMAALIADGIASLDLAAALVGLDADIANINATNQVVLSGGKAGVEQAVARVRELFAGAKLDIVALNVSAPFHSRRMRRIEPAFCEALLSAEMSPTNASVVTSNLTRAFHHPDRESIVSALTGQISGTVDWIANMRVLCAVAPVVYEVGPNRPLQRFFRSIGHEITSILSVKTAEKALARSLPEPGEPKP